MRRLSSRSGLIGREELRAWLAPDSGEGSTFVVALLRDLYPKDADVGVWLSTRRPEFQGLSAADLLRTARADEVETLLVRVWNHATKPQRRPHAALLRLG